MKIEGSYNGSLSRTTAFTSVSSKYFNTQMVFGLYNRGDLAISFGEAKATNGPTSETEKRSRASVWETVGRWISRLTGIQITVIGHFVLLLNNKPPDQLILPLTGFSKSSLTSYSSGRI